MDSISLRDAYRVLLDAATTVAERKDIAIEPPAGEWNADQILAHVSLVTATTIATTATVTAGCNATYDNRMALDLWTINHVVEISGGNAGLRERLRQQAEVLCALTPPALAETELDIPIPTRLVSKHALLVDALMPLRDVFAGLVESELPGHTQQLLALIPGENPSP